MAKRRVERDGEFGRRVVAVLDRLPPRQRSIAEYLLDHQQEVPFLDIPEIARRARTSPATVVRFAQSLGYEGFAELKADVLAALRRRVVEPPPRQTVPQALANAAADDTLADVARQELGNIEHTLAHLDRSQFVAAAAAMLRADHVYTFGLGISSHLAGLLSYLLIQVGQRSTRLGAGYSSPLEQLVVLRPTDLLVAFSFPPYSRKTLEMVQQVSARGIPTIGICDRAAAPISTVARFTLPVKSENRMFTNSFAAASVLLNALSTEIAARDRTRALDAVSRISQVLDEDDGLIP